MKDLKSTEFELNPYDLCVANMILNGKQFTTVWHVDDLKLLHDDPVLVTRFIEWLKTKYEDEEIGKMKASRGKDT